MRSFTLMAILATYASAVVLAEDGADAADVADGADVTEVADVADVADVAVVADVADVTNVADAADTANVADETEVTNSAEVSTTTDGAEVCDLFGTTEEVQSCAVPATAEDIVETTDTPIIAVEAGYEEASNTKTGYEAPASNSKQNLAISATIDGLIDKVD